MFASSQPCVPTITGKIGKAPMTKKMKHRKMQIAKLYLEELKSILLMEDELPPRVPELPLPSADHADFRINDNITKENAVLMLRAFDHNIKSLTLGTRVVEALCEDYEFLEQQPSPFTRLETLILQLPKTSYKPELCSDEELLRQLYASSNPRRCLESLKYKYRRKKVVSSPYRLKRYFGFPKTKIVH